MTFDLSKLETQTPFEAFPELADYPVFNTPIGSLKQDQVLRYVFSYCRKDKVTASISDPKKQREELALKVGWVKSKGKFPETIESIISGTCEEVKNMICFLFRLMNDLDLVTYISTKEAYFQLMDELRLPLDPDLDLDKKLKSATLKITISKGAAEMLPTLNAIKQRLFQDDKDLENIIDTDLQQSDRKEGITERMVREMSQKK